MSTKTENKARPQRKATLAESLIVIAFMLFVLCFGSGVAGINVRVCLIICIFFDMFMAWRMGYKWSDCMQTISKKIGPLSTLFMILLGIGFVIGTWMMAGTVPVLVAWMAEAINPNFTIMLTFLFCAVLAAAIGSNFTTGGTIGLVMFNVAMVQGLPPVVAAAAAASGSAFGSYLSPVADQPNNCASVCGYKTNDVIKELSLPVGIAVVITCIIYFIIGLQGNTEIDVAAQTADLVNAVFDGYSGSLVILLPILVVVVMSFTSLPSFVTLFASGLMAALVGIFVQGFTFKDATTVAWSGFKGAMLGEDVLPMLSTLVSRGGMSSMLEGIIFIFLCVVCTSMMSHMGCFDFLGKVFGNFKTIGGLNVFANIYVMLCALVTADMAPVHVIVSETLMKPYAKLGYSPKKAMAVSIAASRWITLCLPWSFPAVYMATLFDQSVVAMIPAAVFHPLVIIAQIVLTYIGVGNKKLTAEEAERFGIALPEAETAQS